MMDGRIALSYMPHIILLSVFIMHVSLALYNNIVGYNLNEPYFNATYYCPCDSWDNCFNVKHDDLYIGMIMVGIMAVIIYYYYYFTLMVQTASKKIRTFVGSDDDFYEYTLLPLMLLIILYSLILVIFFTLSLVVGRNVIMKLELEQLKGDFDYTSKCSTMINYNTHLIHLMGMSFAFVPIISIICVFNHFVNRISN